jgi:putative hemolysin
MSAAVWLVLTILILANALYVAGEFGVVGVRRSRVRRLSDDGNRLAKRLLPFVDDPVKLDTYVAVSQVGITLSSLILGAFAQATVATALAPRLVTLFGLDVASSASTAAVIVLVMLTGVQVVAAELVPKSLALQFPTEVALATVLPMQWSLAAFRPFIAFINGSAAAVLRMVGISTNAHRHIHSPAEIELLIAESSDGGLLEPAEQLRLHRALQLSLRTARNLMIPRERLTMVSVDLAWNDVVRTIVSSPFSRLPVFSGTPENVVGALRVKDLVHRYLAEGAATTIGPLVRPLVRIKDDLPADQIVTVLREHRVHQAAVTDQAGQVVGLITIADVLSEFLSTGEGPARVGTGAGS